MWNDGVRFSVSASSGGTSVVRGQKAPVFQGWFPKHGIGDVEHYPVPTVLQTGVFTGEYRLVTVLYPHREGWAGIASVEASADPAETSFTLHMSDGRSYVIAE